LNEIVFGRDYNWVEKSDSDAAKEMLATRDKFRKWVEFFQGGGEFENHPFEFIGLFHWGRDEQKKLILNLPPVLYPLHDILYRAATRARVEAEKLLTTP
jgi:hypothetical protein